MFEIHCTASGDSAEAEDAEAALVAAAQLADDYFDAMPVQGRLDKARRSLTIVQDGRYEGALTTLARDGYHPARDGYHRAPLSSGWSS